MHQYLNAIGFRNVKCNRQLNEILSDVEHEPTRQDVMAQDEDMDYCEFRKAYAKGLGIALFGDMDINECFKQQYYFPYFEGSGVTSYADVVVEQRMDRDAFVGICEDSKVEISLIFHLQNTIEYIKEKQRTGSEVLYKSVTLSALCNTGTILLPVKKNKQQQQVQKQESHNRSILMSAAKAGDQAAIESLTLDDIDTYSKVSQRLVKEDVLSIVDTYIMPNGIECDQYSIMGTILNIKLMENACTKEPLYILCLEVNELQFDVCVPARNVNGEPKVGRRFKGNIWLQGRLNF